MTSGKVPRDTPQLHIIPHDESPPRGSDPIPLTLDAARIEELEPYLPPNRDIFLEEDLDPIAIKERAALGWTEIIPWVTVTYAQSIDGQIALNPGERTQISGAETKAMTHYLRSRHDAILIGVGTANADNPGLNCRYSSDGNILAAQKQPVPIILDPSRRWQEDTCPNLFDLVRQGRARAPWWVVSKHRSRDRLPTLLDETLEKRHVEKIEQMGVRVVEAGRYGKAEAGVEWLEILFALGERGIRSVMIEGGAMVINDLLRTLNHRWIDSVILTVGPTHFGTGGAVVSPFRTDKGRKEAVWSDVKWLPYGEDVVMVGRKPKQAEGQVTPKVDGGSIIQPRQGGSQEPIYTLSEKPHH